MNEADAFSKEVIKQIQEAISASGLSNAEIIKRSNISQDYFYTRMRGEKPFTTNDISRIGHAIGVNPMRILIEAGSRSGTSFAGEQHAEVDPSRMSEDEKVQYVLNKLKSGDQTLAASIDPYKEYEKEGGDGR